MRFVLLVLLSFLSISSYSQESIKKSDLKWLLGSWEMDAIKVQIYENWVESANNSYKGTGYVISAGDTIVKETMKIEMVGNYWVFIAQVNNNNPVLFTLKASSKAKELTFENLEHDNPQRVIYTFVDGKNLHARTEALVKGKVVVDRYNYTRH